MKHLGMSSIVLFLCGAGTLCSASSGEDPAIATASALYEGASGEQYVLDRYSVGTRLLRLDLVDPSGLLKDRVFVKMPSDGWTTVHFSCSIEGNPDVNVIAIARYSERDPIVTEVAMAFLVDVEHARVVAIASKNVTCINESCGV